MSSNPSLCEGFAPLHNFVCGHVDLQNTCCSAVVANLRHVLLPVMQEVREHRWLKYIHRVRTSWRGAYRHDPGHDGQHNAAEFWEKYYMITDLVLEFKCASPSKYLNASIAQNDWNLWR